MPRISQLLNLCLQSGIWIWSDCKEDNNENQPYSWSRIPEKSQELEALFFSDLFKLWSWKQRVCLKVCERSFISCIVKQVDVSSVVKLNQRNSKFGEYGCIIGLGKGPCLEVNVYALKGKIPWTCFSGIQ